MLEIKDLSVTYSNNVTALENVTTTLPEGKLIGVIGPNGAGKSSLLKGILGMVNRTGKVSFNGEKIDKIQREIAYVEQKGSLDMDFPITVLETVLLGTYPKLGWFNYPGKKEKEEALASLKSVGMADYSERHISELSGGQFQRVLIARTLVQDAKLIFLDEPFVGIDLTSERIIMKQLMNLRNEGKTILIVHHDLTKVGQYFDELVLVNKHLYASGPVEEVMKSNNLNQVFGKGAFADIGGNTDG